MDEEFLNDLRWEMTEDGFDEQFIDSVIEDIREEMENLNDV